MRLNEIEIRKTLRKKSGVQGYSKKIKKRIRNGIEVDEDVIRVYVQEKLDISMVSVDDEVPPFINGVATDVIEIGKVEAVAIHTGECRPLVGGYSIGNKKISAGTFGWYFTDGSETYLGSNTHVFSETLFPNSVMKAILQPGPSDGGTEVVAYLHWHSPLRKSLNPLSALFMIITNIAFQLIGWEPPFDMADSTPRQLDFAVAKPVTCMAVSHTIEGLTDFDDYCGIAFATSDTYSFFCKERYSAEAGYLPLNKNSKVAEIGDTIHKVGRTTGYTSGNVIDDSVFLWISYGGTGTERPLDDIIMTEKMLEGGDSGSAGWLQVTLDV